MLGEVPISVTSPPSSAPKAIGIRNTEGEMLERRANLNAIGIMIASAPMFLTKAGQHRHRNDEQQQLRPQARELRKVPVDRDFHDARPRHRIAHQQCRTDDDDDVVAEAQKR